MQENQSKQFNKEEVRELRMKRGQMWRKAKIALLIAAVIGGIGGLFWYGATRPSVPEGEIVSQGGVHWHPVLSIDIKGIKQEIPANIGIGMQYAG